MFSDGCFYPTASSVDGAHVVAILVVVVQNHDVDYLCKVL
jgi:hypothetical protein